LDADIIFFAHEYGIWDVLVERYEVYVVATVLEQEAKYFKTPSGTRGSNLRELEAAGKIHRLPRGSPKSGHVGSLQNRPC
jgi:hypothetical protein